MTKINAEGTAAGRLYHEIDFFFQLKRLQLKKEKFVPLD